MYSHIFVGFYIFSSKVFLTYINFKTSGVKWGKQCSSTCGSQEQGNPDWLVLKQSVSGGGQALGSLSWLQGPIPTGALGGTKWGLDSSHPIRDWDGVPGCCLRPGPSRAAVGIQGVNRRWLSVSQTPSAFQLNFKTLKKNNDHNPGH